LGLSKDSFKIGLIDGVFTIKIILLGEFKNQVFHFASKASFVFTKVEPAVTAAFLAKEKYGQICS
jgi:hypothetical protein